MGSAARETLGHVDCYPGGPGEAGARRSWPPSGRRCSWTWPSARASARVTLPRKWCAQRAWGRAGPATAVWEGEEGVYRLDTRTWSERATAGTFKACIIVFAQMLSDLYRPHSICQHWQKVTW